MKLADFGSMVQLGVGLHAGTALLQFVTEFASSPLEQRLARLSVYCEKKSAPGNRFQTYQDRALDLSADLKITVLKSFNDYKYATVFNAAVACILIGCLAWVSFEAERAVEACTGIALVALFFVPAGASIGLLWLRWKINTRHLSKSVRLLSKDVLRVHL